MSHVISSHQKGKLYRAYDPEDFVAVDSSGFHYRKSTNSKVRVIDLGKVSDHPLKSTAVRPDYLSEEEVPNYPDMNHTEAQTFTGKLANTKGGNDGFFHTDDEV